MERDNSENNAQLGNAIISASQAQSRISAYCYHRDYGSGLPNRKRCKERIHARFLNSGGEQRIFVTKANNTIVTLNQGEANHLLKTAKIKIGCVNCPIKRIAMSFNALDVLDMCS